MKSGQYKGNKYFLANANITMPKFTFATSTEEVEQKENQTIMVDDPNESRKGAINYNFNPNDETYMA